MFGAGDVAVVGSGPSGLAAAFRLAQAGFTVRLFESERHVGGKLKTSRRDGFVLDEGATVMTHTYGSLLGIAAEAGLGDEIVPGGDVIGIAREGQIHNLRAGTLGRDALRTKLLSTSSKLRLIRLGVDLAKARKHLSGEDLSRAAKFDVCSAEDYARRHFNREILDYFVDPAARALVGGSADISNVCLLFSIQKFIGARILVFKGGMDAYPKALAGHFKVELSSEVIAVEEKGTGVKVTWRDASGREQVEEVAGCVLAIPAPAAARLRPQLDEWRADFMRQVNYSTMVNVSVALSRPPAGVASTYIQIPTAVHPGIVGIGVEHNRAPDRVPPGKGLIGVYTHFSWARELMEEADDDVVKRVVDAADRVLPGTSDDVEFAQVTRWPSMVLQSRPGFWRDMQRFNELRVTSDRRIQLAGDYFATSNLDTASMAGERAARDLLSALRSSPESLMTAPHLEA